LSRSGIYVHREIEVRWLGEVPYADAAQRMSAAVAARRAGDLPDQLWLLEHPAVITRGSSARAEHVLLSSAQLEERGVDVHDSGRGGDVTLHSPGQLVGYPILDLKPDRKDVHRYLRDLESVLIDTCQALDVLDPHRRPELTGVWTARGKIAALGVRVSSGWTTSHGFALNVDPDLSLFETIVPCGIRDERVTSLAEILPAAPTMERVRYAVVEAFGPVFDASLRWVGPST